MIDKIEQLGAMANSHKSEKIQKKHHPKKVDKGKNFYKGNTSNVEKSESGAKVEISQAAKEQLILRAQAEHYLKQVEEQGGISSDKVDELKQKITDNYYLQEKIIDKIVDKLLRLSGFNDFNK